MGRVARCALPTDPVEGTGTRGTAELVVEAAVCELVPFTATVGKALAFVSFDEVVVSPEEGGCCCCCCSGALSCGDVTIWRAIEEDSGTMRSRDGAVDKVAG